MRHTAIAFVALGALALAAPASAQLVNGLSGPNYNHDAPLGTKAGGAISTLQAPGEQAAITGAMRNEMDAKAMRPTSEPLTTASASVRTPVRVIARNEPVTGNEFTRAKLRLDSDSE